MNKWQYYYPRPNLKRDSFFSLDGKWLLNDQEIEVPFPPESKLSGYKGSLSNTLVYTKEFQLPKGFKKQSDSVILHFGAVDQIAEIYLNDTFISKHEGGYLPFDCDISNVLTKNNSLKVIVKDNLNKFYPYGKQTDKPEGMWYTPFSGIWKSVWIEAVPKNGIKTIKIKANKEKIILDIDSTNISYIVSFPLDKKHSYKQLFETNHIEIDVSKFDMHPWSPEDPYLYPLTVSTNTDKVESYFAIREVKQIGNKLYLNDKPLLMAGVLDQGYFENGLVLPEDPAEYFDEVLRMKELGFNVLRKHIKIEPEVFYYACDKLGMLVIQDMVNSGDVNFVFDTALPTIGFKYKNDTLFIDKKREEFFIKHSIDTINHLYNYPSIICWTIFNEGWGQQNSDKAYKTLKALDPDRLFDSTSGWFKQKLSDFKSEHIYFRNKVLKNDTDKLLFLSECGGYKYPVKEHLYKSDKEYGYGKVNNSKEELTDTFQKLYEEMLYPSIENGLCGFIITQLSDVETEINGFYTYDRQVCKVDKKRIYQLNNKAYKLYQEEKRI